MSGIVDTDEDGNVVYTDISKLKQEQRLEELKDDVIRYLYKIDDPDKGVSILSDYDIEDLAIKIVDNIDELSEIINGKVETLWFMKKMKIYGWQVWVDVFILSTYY